MLRRFKQLNLLKRSYSTIHLNNEPIKYAPEMTLFIKGFLSKGEQPEDFHIWKNSHQKLVNYRKMDPHAKGWYWNCGKIKYPIPIASISHAAFIIYRGLKIFNPIYLAASSVIDISILTTQLIHQYHFAEDNTDKMSDKLTCDLKQLSKRYSKVRVIAHSLGCKLLLNAIRKLPEKYRPSTIHLLAPALVEHEYSGILNTAAKNHTYVYYSKKDTILYTIYHIIKKDDAVGAYGLINNYNNVTQLDVSEYFNKYWLVHHNYKHVYPEFLVDDKFSKN